MNLIRSLWETFRRGNNYEMTVSHSKFPLERVACIWDVIVSHSIGYFVLPSFLSDFSFLHLLSGRLCRWENRQNWWFIHGLRRWSPRGSSDRHDFFHPSLTLPFLLFLLFFATFFLLFFLSSKRWKVNEMWTKSGSQIEASHHLKHSPRQYYHYSSTSSLPSYSFLSCEH